MVKWSAAENMDGGICSIRSGTDRLYSLLPHYYLLEIYLRRIFPMLSHYHLILFNSNPNRTRLQSNAKPVNLFGPCISQAIFIHSFIQCISVLLYIGRIVCHCGHHRSISGENAIEGIIQ